MAAIWAQYRGVEKVAARRVATALLGCAFLTKGAAAVPLLLTLVLVHLIRGDGRQWVRKDYVWAFLVPVMIVVPWYLAQSILHGLRFWEVHVGLHVWERATRPLFLHEPDVFYYVRFLASRLAYLWPLALLGLWLAAEAITRDRGVSLPGLAAFARRPEAITLTAPIVVPLVLYSVARTQIWWYILPTVPFLAIAAGWLLGLAIAWANVSPGIVRPVLAWTLALAIVITTVKTTAESVTAQIRNGIVVYSGLAQTAARVREYAVGSEWADPVVFFPRVSPTVAAYVPFRVYFDPNYTETIVERFSLKEGSQRSAIMIIDRERVLESLTGPFTVSIVARSRGWALALVRGSRVW